ncbi:BTAD domain-containing putative transcriptional regulator [Actinophytocola sediminis]
MALGSARPRAVFTMLVLRQNAVVSRTELIDGVWGDDPPATAAGSLHTYISTLRKSLEPGRARGVAPRLLTSVGAGYRLQVRPERVDVVEFTRLRVAAQRQLAEGHALGAMRTLDEALALWHGEALSGVYGPFAATERARLGELRVATVELWAEAGLAAGRHADLVAELATLVHDHPLRERPRELLMLALHRCGRTAEALATYREARETLVDELGIEPSPPLRRLHDQILADDPALRPSVRSAAESGTVRAGPALVGRAAELAVIDDLVHEVTGTGRGRCLWIEGELGIGKSSLVAAALARAAQAGCQLAHAAADELGQRFPLRLALDCLDVATDSPDRRRAAIAATMHDDRSGQPIVTNAALGTAAIDQVVGLVKTLCADGPLVLALDDLHWSDEASMLVWHRLARETARRPLLLIGATRPAPHRTDLERLRRDVATGDGVALNLTPLTEPNVATLVNALVGAPPGPRLRGVTARASGNPLYVREITDALMRDRAVAVGTDTAEVAPEWLERAPGSLASAVTGRLGYLSNTTLEVLRSAALLGAEFAVGDLSLVLGKPVSELVRSFDEAIATNVLRDAGTRLVFRHPVIRQALYEGMAVAVRNALHHQVAQALAQAGAPFDQVASQLLAADDQCRPWVADWLTTATPVLTFRAPLVAVELLRRVLRSPACDHGSRVTLRALLAGALFRISRDAEAEEHARAVLPQLSDPNLIAKIRWILAYVPYRASRAPEALLACRDALNDPAVPDMWRARLTSLLALIQRAGMGELEIAADTARRAIELGERAGDRFAVAQALEILWQVDAIRRDYLSAVGWLDEAMAVVGTDLHLTDLRLLLLDNRMFTLQCLDRLDEATADLELAFQIAGDSHPSAGMQIAGAVHDFWLGRWDSALGRIEAVLGDPRFTGFGLREGGGPGLLMYGVAALISAHRDDSAALERYLDGGLNLPMATEADRENCDFLVAAQSIAQWRQGNPREAVTVLGAILDSRYALMMLRHQWLPDLVRMALELGDEVTARAAVKACEVEAAQEVTPARAAVAATRCRCLLDGDPDGLVAVIDHYAAVGRSYELAQTCEDHAVLLHRAGREHAAGAALARAVGHYRALGADWDIRRAHERMRS